MGPSLRLGEKSRPTPSAFMMNAPNCPGGESALKSGTSPTHFSPFQAMPGRVGSQGLPWASAEQRLYMTRRLAGQLNVHSGYLPRPLGSALFRRCVRLPASVYMPMCSQSPESVEPSARRSRNFPTCWPALSTMVFGSFSSLRSSMAQPLISLQTSTCEGLDRFEYHQFRFRTGSGNFPPSFL